MTQLLDTGSLKLFDKVIEYTGRDVYFLTEDETIEGYSKLNGIIKVIHKARNEVKHQTSSPCC